MATAKKAKKAKPAKKTKRPKRPPAIKKDVNAHGVVPRSRTATIRPADEGEVDSVHWLRQLAQVHYITSRAGVSVPAMAKIAPFNQVSRHTLERWCNEDGWVVKRSHFFAGVRAELEKQIQKNLISKRVEMLHSLEDLYGRALERLETKVIQIDDGEIVLSGPEVKSFEGLLQAMVRIVDQSERLRDKITDKILPDQLGQSGDEAVPGVKPTLSNEEAREAAMAVVRRRQAEARQELDQKGD